MVSVSEWFTILFAMLVRSLVFTNGLHWRVIVKCAIFWRENVNWVPLLFCRELSRLVALGRKCCHFDETVVSGCAVNGTSGASGDENLIKMTFPL